jgi:hypothetical protein
MAAGITLLSIAHRPTLKRFHQLVVHIDGTVSTTGKGWWTEVRSAGGAWLGCVGNTPEHLQAEWERQLVLHNCNCCACIRMLLSACKHCLSEL